MDDIDMEFKQRVLEHLRIRAEEAGWACRGWVEDWSTFMCGIRSNILFPASCVISCYAI